MIKRITPVELWVVMTSNNRDGFDFDTEDMFFSEDDAKAICDQYIAESRGGRRDYVVINASDAMNEAVRMREWYALAC